MYPKVGARDIVVLAAAEAETKQITHDIEAMSKAGTMQLRKLAKVMHVKNYSKLKRDDLILAIIAKKKELWEAQQLKLWSEESVK